MPHLLMLLVLFLPLQAKERQPVTVKDAEIFRSLTTGTFDQFKSKLPSYGATGGFFPRILSKDMLAGVVYGMCRRHPARMEELLSVKLKDGFADYVFGSMLLAGGRPLLVKAAEKDERVAKFLKEVPADISFSRMDPTKRGPREFLLVAVIVHADLLASARLIHGLTGGDEAVRSIAAVAILNRGFYEFCRDLQPIAQEPYAKELAWVCAQAKPAWSKKR